MNPDPYVMERLLGVYLDPNDIGPDGYPFVWHRLDPETAMSVEADSVKDLVRGLAGYRCVRCGHPYPQGIARLHPRGEWTPCDEHCTHGGQVGDTLRYNEDGRTWEAQWRILTVHHLNGAKYDLRWWNIAALCQRCHLAIQGRVVMDRVYVLEHSDWFKPYAAGWYAAAYLEQELTREETMARLDELLALERA